MKRALALLCILAVMMAHGQAKQKYLRLGKLTTTERDAIDVTDTSVAYTCYNVTTGREEINTGSGWVARNSGGGGGGASGFGDLAGNPYENESLGASLDSLKTFKAADSVVVKTIEISPTKHLTMWYGPKALYYVQNPVADIIILPDSTQGVQDITGKADKINVLQLNNAAPFVPDADYEPATKKYVDDHVGGTPVETVEENIYGTVETADVTGIKNMDLSAYSAFKYNLTGNTTLTDSNPPSSGKSTVKTVFITASDAYTLTFPSSWDRIVGDFVSAKINLITVSYINDGTNMEVDAIITQMN